jgi:hypothetical protein
VPSASAAAAAAHGVYAGVRQGAVAPGRDNWRTERIDLFDGAGMQPYDFDEKKPWDLPHDGLIECDYVSTNVGHRLRGDPPCSEELFARLLEDLRAVWKAITVGVKPKQRRRGLRRASVTVSQRAPRGGRYDGLIEPPTAAILLIEVGPGWRALLSQSPWLRRMCVGDRCDESRRPDRLRLLGRRP